MLRFIQRLIAALTFVTIVAGLNAGIASPANAASSDSDKVPCPANVDVDRGKGTCYEDGTAEVTDSKRDRMKNVNGIKYKAKTLTRVLRYVRANGMPRTQIISAQQAGNVYTAPHGMTLWTSYINIHGQEVWHQKYYPAGYKFYKGPDGWFHDPKCNNKVKIPPTKKTIPGKKKLYGEFKIVKRFKFWGTAWAQAHGTAKAKVKSWSNGYLVDEDGNYVRDENGHVQRTCHALAEAEGVAEFFARAKAKVRGKVYASVEAALSAVAEGAQAELNGKLEGEVKGDVEGYVRASARGNAYVNLVVKTICEDTVQESNPKPILVEISTINDVLVNNTRTNTVNGSVAPGHAGSLFCTARNGGTITQGKQQTVSGNFSVQHTYLAPSEVPGANSQYGIAAGRDRVDCTLTQDDGRTAMISTNQFEIRPAPVDPM